MPEHLKAMIVVLALATAVFAFSRKSACAVAMAGEDFARRRNLWLCITATLFLAHNFWIFIAAAAVLLLFALPREPNKLAMYYFLLFAVPNFSSQITGLGIIQHFFTIDFFRLLSLTVLLPAFLHELAQPDREPLGRSLPDKFLAGYLILQFILMLQVSTFTNTLRIGIFYAFIDVFLPYYVASRSIRNIEGFRDALMAFVAAALVLASIGIFEFARHWLLYTSLTQPLGVTWEIANYMARGDSLRAIGSSGHGIALGYVLAVAIGIFLYVKRLTPSAGAWSLGLAALTAGLVVTISRGPWLGAAAILLVFIATGPAPGKGLMKLALLGLAALPVLLAFPTGRNLLASLPLVGTLDEASASVLYRQRLFEISIQVISQHPFFGAFDYFYSSAFQELKQGQGFLDIVNTYLGVALGSGLVGLTLFAGFFIAVGAGIFRAMRRVADGDDEHRLLGRALFATLLGILVTIFTVSSISAIPLVYWSLAGLGVAYARMLAPVETPAQTPRLRGYAGLQTA